MIHVGVWNTVYAMQNKTFFKGIVMQGKVAFFIFPRFCDNLQLTTQRNMLAGGIKQYFVLLF